MYKRFLCLLLALCLMPVAAPALTGPLYEVFPASFRDGNNDGMGDLQGVREALPYISLLGVKGLWLTPIAPSPSYHKYDVVDYCAIDPSFGTMEDFEALAAACKARGIKLILDLVINHTSNEHPWFQQAVNSLKTGQDSPYRDYYTFTDGPDGHPVPGVPGKYYVGGFGPHMPDLNLDNENVRSEIKAIIAFWLGKGAQGFRLDATTWYYEQNAEKNRVFLSWLNTEVKAIAPAAYLIGEAWTDESVINTLYQSGIDSFFDFPLHGANGLIVKALQEKNGAELAEAVAGRYERLQKAAPDGQNAPFLGNHDTGRIAGVLRMKHDRLKAAFALAMLLPGVPMIYYGDELGMTGSGRDENKRLPMLWGENEPGLCLPPGDADQQQRQKMGVKEQEAASDSLLNYVRAVMAARSECPEFSKGTLKNIATGIDSVCAFRVEYRGSSLKVMHNLGAEPVTLTDIDGAMIFAGDTGTGAPTLANGTLTLYPLSTCIIR